MRPLRSTSLALGLSLLFATTIVRAQEPAGGDTPAGDDKAASSDTPASEQPARPPPPPETAAPSIPWPRHIEVGGDIALVTRPASIDDYGDPSRIRYRSAIGYGVHGRWDVFRYLRFSAYYLRTRHEVVFPSGSLGLDEKLTLSSIKTYSFGARLSPTMPWTPRLRSWLTGGVGWGRIEIGRMTVGEGAGAFEVRERSASFVEIPLGLGTSFDIIPNWLSIDVEVTGAFVLGQEGTALHEAQAIDAAGKKRQIGSFPLFDAAFVQTLGLSLIL